MTKQLLIGVLFAWTTLGFGQMYFPPLSGNQWDTINAASLGWCENNWDTLDDYLRSKGTKSFLVLHRGKIVHEKYFGSFQPDSVWYWASAGKTLMAYLIGRAQEDGLLSITDKSSTYLGSGWTIAPPAKEDLIKVQDQLQMTTGLDYNVSDLDCTADSCLNYKADAGTQWYYHNAPYLLLHDVLTAATNKTTNQYVFSELHQKIGFSGFWAGTLYVSNPRAMGRFGLLMLNKGSWDGQQLMQDSAYWLAMINSSQGLNPAYGYLTWLNGKGSFIQPGLAFSFPGAIVPSAPADMYMAAGKNEQRIYVVPSLDLVVVRQGEAAGSPALAISGFDDEVWLLLNQVLFCQPISEREIALAPAMPFPNPAVNRLVLPDSWSLEVGLYHLNGAKVSFARKGRQINFEMAPGLYVIRDLLHGFSAKVRVQ